MQLQLPYTLVSRFLGVLLLAAAGMKIHGLLTDPLSQDSFPLSTRLQIAMIEAEVILGLWLLSGWARRGAWLAALGFFGVLAGVSLYLALVGQRSCGCFGRVPVNPWLTFSLDVIALIALFLSRPVILADVNSLGGRKGSVAITAGVAALLALVGCAFFIASEHPFEALARLRGEVVAVQPTVSDLGDGTEGEERRFSIELNNLTEQPMRIVGGTANCSCVATESLPILLPPGEPKTVEVRVKFRGSVGQFQHSFLLMTDQENQPAVIARFVGRVVESRQE